MRLEIPKLESDQENGNPNNMALYTIRNVIDRKLSHTILYVCFERLEDGQFAVLQSEHLYPKDAESNTRFSEIMALSLELVLDEEPSERCDWFISLAMAIQAHEIEFDLKT
jgi:hypothetical protein